MAMSRYAIVGLLITGFVIGANLVSVQKAAAFLFQLVLIPKLKNGFLRGRHAALKIWAGSAMLRDRVKQRHVSSRHSHLSADRDSLFLRQAPLGGKLSPICGKHSG
jgi:hypothetical protein